MNQEPFEQWIVRDVTLANDGDGGAEPVVVECRYTSLPMRSVLRAISDKSYRPWAVAISDWMVAICALRQAI